MWRHVSEDAGVLQEFADEMASVAKHLGCTTPTGFKMVWTSPTLQNPELVCPSCGAVQHALLGSMQCDDVACASCWKSWAESQLPFSYAQCRASVRCLGAGCQLEVSPSCLRCIASWSEPVRVFANTISSEIAGFQLHVSRGVQLRWASTALSEPPLLCPICRENCRALHEVAQCGHGACESCWMRWAEAQLANCCAERVARPRCFGQGCQQVLEPALWQQVCSHSTAVRDFNLAFRWRSRLQNNHLFPAEMQVDCSREGCLGLGYLGFEMVMCFMCEHSWPADGGLPAADLGEERILGLALKKCPACTEYIEKNGGCDHMTCRCQHQFSWTTLQKWRPG